MTLYHLHSGSMTFWRGAYQGERPIIRALAPDLQSPHVRSQTCVQLSRRLAVYFDKIFGVMEHLIGVLTNDQQEATLGSFRDLVREQIELRELISSTLSESQQVELIRHASMSFEEPNAVFTNEETILAGAPAARGVHEERQATHEAITDLGTPMS